MAVLYATNAKAAEKAEIQENIGEPSVAQNMLLVIAEPTENFPHFQKADPRKNDSGSVAVSNPTVEKSTKVKKPVEHSVKMGKRLLGSELPSSSHASSRIGSKSTNSAGGNMKAGTSDKLQLLLSTTLSIPEIFSNQPASPTTKSDVPRRDSDANEKSLSELYAQIAETEMRIRAQQHQLDVLDSPSNSGVVGTGVVAQGVAASKVPDIAKEKIKPPKVVPDVRSASYGLIGEIESLVTSWMDLAIGLMVILLTLLGFAWYRKANSAHLEQHSKLPVISEEIEETEFAEAPAIAETSRTEVVRTIKTPAHTEQKIQSMLPPEYEMLEEADIYLRFGHDKLAEEALREAIKINPRNPQAYLTLSRICFSQENTVAFLALAKQIKSLGDEDVWHKVAEMGRSLDPNNTLYN